jgi:hypothetical protein
LYRAGVSAVGFEATLGDDEGRPVIELPFDPKAKFGRARAPVVATVNGHSFRTTVAVYGGRHYIGLRADVRNAAQVELGEMVEVEIELDDRERTVEVPADLATALAEAGVRDAFDSLSYSRRREHVEAVIGAKRPETRRRRIDRAVEALRATD